ncbi:MalY/PatB family protein [Aliikangiella maris]|uniref:cysteine-S-conjugate beta-lyase n=2 Tax=Aliikangiella maris TaxID=3162458 RepID=A0ABV2BX90_9GAMM
MNKPYISLFDNPPNRKGTNTFKWDFNHVKYGREDVIPMWIADMDFAVPQVITQALAKRIKHPVYGYSYRSEDYVDAIVNWLAQYHDWPVNKKHLAFYPPGTVSAINMLINQLTEIGDEILVFTPSYPPLMKMVNENQRILVESPLIKIDNEYQMDFENFRTSISSKTRLLLFCSPHNPTGRVWREEELLEVATICRDNNIVVISDEVHADLLLAGKKHTHFNRLAAHLRPTSVTIISPGKTFNIAALSQSTLICDNKALMQNIQRQISTAHLSLDNAFSATATQAAYSHGLDWLNALLDYLKTNREFIHEFLSANLPKVVLVSGQGTYLAWLDFSAIRLSHEDIYQKLIKQAGVGLYNGLEFGDCGEKFFRLNFACSHELLKKAMYQIYQVFREF